MNGKILWADDEIELLKPHVLFLTQKGYEINTVTNGYEVIDKVKENPYDIIFLDENMPGLGGLETLQQIKQISPHTPVVMITKSEEEHIMEDAIGSKIADYLIKPVNPNQILLSCKKLLEGKSLVSSKTNKDYLQEFRNISMAIYEDMSFQSWIDVYKKLIYWDLELEKTQDKGLLEVFQNQKNEANQYFCKYYTKNYVKWVNATKQNRPMMSPDVMESHVFPHLKNGEQVFFILIDCMRFDQWKVFEPVIKEYYNVESEDAYFSILPTATQYARNAIFSGLFPLEIAKKYPKLWLDDDEEGGKNLNEEMFLTELIVKNKLNVKFSYNKVISNEEGKELDEKFHVLKDIPFNAIVFNFIDLFAHAKTEMNLVKELTPNESALRSVTKAWLEHSWFLSILKKIKDLNAKVIITSDHGMVSVKRPLKIIGDRATTTNLRYKQGKNLNYDKNRIIFAITKPEDAKLPKTNVTSTYAFAMEDGYFCYPNNYNYYVNLYKDTFQHGGVSLEEVIVPLITLSPK